MKILVLFSVSIIMYSFSGALFADSESHEQKICGVPNPILQVADVDGSGSVDSKDLVIIKKAIKRKQYYAFYDFNSDGELNKDDLELAKQDINQNSSALDQQLAKIFHQVKQFQLIDSKEELSATGFSLFTSALSGHGVHWANLDGILSAVGAKPIDFNQAEGINFTKKGDAAKGMFWTTAAIPVFENGATDYPTPGGAWMTSRVVAFANSPPQFSDSPHEHWHTHAALCITSALDGQGIERVTLNQHTTFLQCQTYPSILKSAFYDGNIWVNLWMLHLWMFDLNPNGLFAGTHPCVDPNAPSETTINGGREVPAFFQGRH